VVSATSNSSAKVVSCQCRVLANLELGNCRHSAIRATTRSHRRDGWEAMRSSRPSLRILVRMASTCPYGSARDLEGVSGGNEGLALEGALDERDEVLGEMGEVAARLVSDGFPVADGTAEQIGDVGLPLGDPFCRSHMNGAASCCHAVIFRGADDPVKRTCDFLVATFPSRNRC
jgi:hypothetical protein